MTLHQEEKMMKVIANKAEYEQILKENKSVFVDFYADWCGPCKMVGPVVEKLAEKHPNVTFVKVNVDTCPDVAMMYGIMSIPTLIAFKDGEIAAQTLGFQPEAALEKIVAAAE